jgi:cob(I)alamin adenosyltransferase
MSIGRPDQRRLPDEREVTTRREDGGHASTFSGDVLPNHDAMFVALGDVDETFAWVGLLRSVLRDCGVDDRRHARVDRILRRLRTTLGRGMALLSSTPCSGQHDLIRRLSWRDARFVEACQHPLRAQLHIALRFDLPGDRSRGSATAHVARSRCRVAGRSVVPFICATERRDVVDLQQFLNRGSDLLFVAAVTVD